MRRVLTPDGEQAAFERPSTPVVIILESSRRDALPGPKRERLTAQPPPGLPPNRCVPALKRQGLRFIPIRHTPAAGAANRRRADETGVPAGCPSEPSGPRTTATHRG
jgi:hypothetical protein